MRLNSIIRNKILASAMKNVPVISYTDLLIPIVGKVIQDHLPKEISEIAKNPQLSQYLQSNRVLIKRGNGLSYNTVNLYDKSHGQTYFSGLTCFLEVRLDQGAINQLIPSNLRYKVAVAVNESGYFDKYVEQEELRSSVRDRLEATLNSVASTKRLYDVLEPELHHLIPKEDDVQANLPATATHVVADLKKLGATFPA
jgi:hypothetical protein